MHHSTAILFAPGKGRTTAWREQVVVDPKLGLLAVADPLWSETPGPPDAARAAARIALDGAHAHVSRHADLLVRFTRHPTPALRDRVLQIVEEGFTRAAREVFAFARRHQGLVVTLDLVLLLRTEAFVGHVGDGRVLLARRGIVHQLTVDHSQEDGGLAPLGDGAANTLPPSRRRLLRALGPRPTVNAETLTMELADGDRFVVTTRSLRHRLAEADVHEVLLHGTLDDLQTRILARAPTMPLVGAAAQIGTFEDADGQQRLARLKPMPLFAHCTDQELRQVARATHPRRFRRGAVLFHQGDPGSEMFLLLHGRIRIERDGQHIATLGPGSNFGEMAMLDEPIRSATAVAEDHAEVLVIHKDAYFKLLRSNPRLAVKILWNMLLTLSRALRRTSARLAEVTDDGSAPRPPTADQPLEAFDLLADDDVDTLRDD